MAPEHATASVCGDTDNFEYQGLLDPSVIDRKAADERDLRAKVAADPAALKACGDAWDHIAAAEEKLAAYEREYFLLERGDAFECDLFHIARHLVRLAAER